MNYGFKTTPFFACIGAVVSVGNSSRSSIAAFINRNLGTLIGGSVGIVLASLTSQPLILSIGVIPVIILLTSTKRFDAIVPGLIVFFAVVYLNLEGASLKYGIDRIIQTFIGSLIGLIVNFSIKGPNKTN